MAKSSKKNFLLKKLLARANIHHKIIIRITDIDITTLLIGLPLFVLIFNNGYNAQNHVMLVNNATTPTTYKTICKVPASQKYAHTIARMAIKNLIKRSKFDSFVFMFFFVIE